MISTDSSTYSTLRPKAFLNWMVVGEDYVAATGSSNHVAAIQIPICNSGDTMKTIVGLNKLVVRRNGWIYIYVSNESNQDVYFDNLVVNLTHGPLMEQKDYYAFGMQNPALSTQAIKYQYKNNRYTYTDKELQSQEFVDSSGLNEYDFGARFYDPQIGRWNVIDPLSEKNRRWSPYTFANDNSVRFIDPDGMETDDQANAAAERMGLTRTDYEILKVYGDISVDVSGGAGDNDQINVEIGGESTCQSNCTVNNNGTSSNSNSSDPGKGTQKKDDKKTEDPSKKNESYKQQSHTSPPKGDNPFPAFPGAERVKSPGTRPRWKLPNGQILEWDYQHGNVELWDKNLKNHLGGFDPNTGKQLQPAKSDRTANRIEGTSDDNGLFRAMNFILNDFIPVIIAIPEIERLQYTKPETPQYD